MKKIHIAVVAAFVCCQVLCIQSADPYKRHSTLNNTDNGQGFKMITNRINRVEEPMLNEGIDALTSENITDMLDHLKARVEQVLNNGGIDVSQALPILDLIYSIRERVALAVSIEADDNVAGNSDNVAGDSDDDSPIENKQDNTTTNENIY